LPSTVPSGRYHNDFPRHAAEQVRAIIGLLECQRSLRYVAIGLFLLGHQVRKTTLRTAFGALAQGTSKQIGSQSKSRDPSEQADAATEALMRMIRRKRLLTAVRQQLGHEGAPAPDRIVRRALKSFFLVFLNGKTMLGVAEAGLRDLVNAVPIVPGVPPAVVDAIKRQAGSHRLSIGGALAGTPLESALSYAFLAERLSLNKLQQTAANAERADFEGARKAALLALNATTARFGPGLVRSLRDEDAQGDLLLALFILSIASVAIGLREQGHDLYAAIAKEQTMLP